MAARGETVLVTGGIGFIGSWFCEALLDSEPHTRVVCLDKLTYCTSRRTVDLLRDQFGERFVLLQADLADSATFARLASEFPEITSAAHFAAESYVDKSFEEPATFVQSNIVGTLNLLEYARRQNLQKVLHVSTDEVYGEALNCSEDNALNPTNPYAATKASAEMLMQAYHKSWSIYIVTVRCSNVYGPRQYPEKIVPAFCKALMSTPPRPCVVQGQGTNRRRYLYASDAAAAMKLLFRDGKSGIVYNVGADASSELENRQVSDLLIDLAGLSDRRSELVRFGNDRVYNDAQYSMTCDRLARLGWKPLVDLQVGMSKCLAWERNNAEWFS